MGETPEERSISAGSRPSLAHHSSRTACLCAMVSALPKPCQMVACSATILSVLRSPPPPMRTGMSRVGGGIELGPALLDERQVAGEVVQPAAGRAELVAVLVVVALEPARPDAEDEPAAADVVDGPGHVGEQLRVAVAVAGDQRADLDPRGRLGPGAEHRPALEVRAVGLAVEREEVVPVEDDVDADLLGLAPRRDGSRRTRRAAAGAGPRSGSAGQLPSRSDHLELGDDGRGRTR